MKRVILTQILDPSRKIVAIKSLRAATRPPEGQAMDLKAAKDIVDNLTVGVPSDPIEVWNAVELESSFVFRAIPDPESVVDKSLVLEFVLDALAYSDPESAYRIMGLPSFARIREALR